MALLALSSIAMSAQNNREFQPVMNLVQTIRDATEPYKSVEAAEAAGYGLFLGCVSGPQGGAMGVHYPNGELVGDGVIDPTQPEVLIYEVKKGRYDLVGVEFLVLAEDWDANNASPPVLMGQLFHYVGSPNRYGMPAFYELHVWAWKNNPSGLFADWNPNVSCDGYVDSAAHEMLINVSGADMSGISAELSSSFHEMIPFEARERIRQAEMARLEAMRYVYRQNVPEMLPFEVQELIREHERLGTMSNENSQNVYPMLPFEVQELKRQGELARLEATAHQQRQGANQSIDIWTQTAENHIRQTEPSGLNKAQQVEADRLKAATEYFRTREEKGE
jgi:hypothetical protein